MNAILQLPAVLNFADYHEIEHISDDVNKFISNKKDQVKESEVGFDGWSYWGLFYVGKKPTKAEITKLLDDAGYEPEEDQ